MGFLWAFSRIGLGISLCASLVGGCILALSLWMVAPGAGGFEPAAGDSGLTAWIAQHPTAFALAFTAFWLMGVVGSAGLLRKRLWGLWIWIVLLSVGIVWFAGGVLFELLASSDRAVAGVELVGRLGRFRGLFASGVAAIAVVFCALYVWLLRKLLSREVRASLR